MLSADEVESQAVALADWADFGASGYREGLEKSLAAFTELPLTDTARTAAERHVVRDLANRLRIERHCRQHPDVPNTEVEGPVLVFGLPRTGTTATVAMMALDPRFRFLRGWEAARPVPPPRLADESTDPRAVTARRQAASYANQAQHLFDPDGPEEDLVMLAGLDMHSYHGAYPMPDWYIDWWISEDFAATYSFHRKTLQVLQSERPPHLWLLKAPVHLFKLEAFAAEYPNARFVMTHRDPAKVIGSVCSLHYRLHSERCDPSKLPDRATYGPRYLAFWGQGMERALAARARIGNHRFIDVYNDEVVKRPLETFTQIYAELGWEINDGLKAALRSYVEQNARGAHGEHRYTVEEYGLTAGAVHEAFHDYIGRFGI